MGNLFTRLLALAFLIAAPTLRLRACRDQRRPRVADNDGPFGLGRNLCLADILRQGRSCDAEWRLPAKSDVRHGPLRQVRQRADAAFHLLLWPIRDPRHERGRQSRPAGVARLRPHFARQCGDAVRHGAEAGGGNPHCRVAVQRYRAQRTSGPDRRWGLRRSVIRGRSKNGRAIRSRSERSGATVTDRINNASSRAEICAPGCRVFFPFRISGHREFELAEAV